MSWIFCVFCLILLPVIVPEVGARFDTGLENIGLVIRGIDTPLHHRIKRKVEPRPTKYKTSDQKRKYRRLEHAINIRGEVRSRYALTLVENEVQNDEDVSREVFFNVILPETAFISKFALEVDGKIYLAEIQEKDEAWKTYKEAKEQGKSAGHVGLTARHSNRFKVSVNTEPQAIVRFYLLYEELLRRKNGIYSYIINISPQQKLSDYQVEVNIAEQTKLTRLTVPELKSHFMGVEPATSEPVQLKDAVIKLSSDALSATVEYSPNLFKLMDKVKDGPLQFVVEYEVERLDIGGQLQLYDGYFVHFVAPSNLPPIPKHVVFVLDTSGSMQARKMQQTKNAMKTIIGEMRDQDFITILRFSSNISVWEIDDDSIVPASPQNRQAAADYVGGLEASGGTNINSALVKALTIITHVKQKGVFDDDVQSMIFFLTDGHPTEGITDKTQIMVNVREANSETDVAIFSLAFGMNTDFDMLKTLSLQNNGFARKIYAAADAELQLEGLYKEVSSPILSNVEFDYMNSSLITQSVTETVFHTFYQGSELIVAGLIDPDIQYPIIEYEITAHQHDGLYRQEGFSPAGDMVPISETVDAYIDFLPNQKIEYNFLERLWAFLTVQNLFVKLSKGELVSCDDKSNKPIPQLFSEDGESRGEGIVICNNLQRALFLSLKYEFVTPLTSLVVVKPDKKENGEFGEADKFSESKHMDINLHSSATITIINPSIIIAIIIYVY